MINLTSQANDHF